MSVDETNLHFMWIETGRLAVSGFPEQETDVRWLHTQGIRAIITLSEQALTYCFITPMLLESLDIVNYHEPIDNRGVLLPLVRVRLPVVCTSEVLFPARA